MYYIYDKTNQWRCSVATLRWSNVVKISPLLLPYYPASSAGHHSYSASSNKHHVLSQCPATLLALLLPNSCLLSIMTYWTLARLLHSLLQGREWKLPHVLICTYNWPSTIYIPLLYTAYYTRHLPSHFLLFWQSVLHISTQWQHPTTYSFS